MAQACARNAPCWWNRRAALPSPDGRRARAARSLAGLWLVAVVASCVPDAPEHSSSPAVAVASVPPASPSVTGPAPPAAAVAAAIEAPPEAPSAAAERGGSTAIAGTSWSQADVLTELSRARIVETRPVGTTSTVFHAQLDAPLAAAFKVPSGSRPNAALNEVAAYRLARCLGLSNVPPAVLRRVSKAELYRSLSPAYAGQWSALEARMRGDGTGHVEGALIYWIDELRELGLEAPGALDEAVQWLSLEHEPPPERRRLARELSTLFAFDYLIGNWDRWSGGNLMGDAGGEHVYMRDNDAAFPSRLGERLMRRMLQPVLRTERYSRSFVRALRGLTRESFARELARDPALVGRIAVGPGLDPQLLAAGITPPLVGTPGRRVLRAAAFDGVFDRRDTLLTHLAALIEEHGEARVLAFP